MAIGSFKLPITSGASEWTRPADWLPMPTVTAANDTFVGLYAVFPEGQNFAAFLFTTSAGQYQVDWGDGTIDLVNSNIQAQHEYDYATISNSTLTSRGYKQSIITVTAVSGLLRTCNLQRRFTTSPIQNQNYATGFLDCILSMPNANGGASIIIGGNAFVRHAYCERFDIKTIGACTSISNLFFNFHSLQSVPLFNTSNVTDISSMFQNCLLLQNIPLFNTVNVTNMFGLFAGCSSLREVPLFNSSLVTNMGSMFQGCASLQSVPLFNTPLVTNMAQMFLGCSALKTTPLFNTQNVTSMVNMFNSCISLQRVPLFNTINVTNMQSLFSSCGSLQSAPLFNTALVTNMSGMFLSCSSINSTPNYITPLITTTSGTDFGGIFQNCSSLDRVQMSFSRSVTVIAQLSRTALVEVFNNLVSRTATTSATINISNNWGASALTAGERAIATSKNWVIVG